MFCEVNTISYPKGTSLQQERLAGAIAALGSDVAPANKTRIAAAAGFKKQILGQLLSGEKSMTQHWAGKLAPVLRVTPGYLMGTDELPEAAAS